MTVTQDDTNRIWLGTKKGLSLFEDGKFTNYTTAEGLSNDEVLRLLFSQKTGLWIGTAGGLDRFRDGRITVFGAKSEIADLSIDAISEDSKGELWLGTVSKGLFRANVPNDTVIPEKTLNGTAETGIYSIYQDSDESMWVGTSALGLYRFRSGRFRTMTTADGLSEDETRAVFQDRSGNFWVSTTSKLNRLSEGNVKVFSASETFQKRVRAITEDSAGNLWIGGTDGISQFKDNRFIPWTIKNGLSENSVFTMLGDRAGNIWVGTVGGGLNKFENKHFTVYTTKEGLADNVILSLFEDRSGAIWIGTPTGLSRWQDGKITSWTTDTGLESNHILSFYEDADGVLWLGTGDNGLMRFKDEKFTSISRKNGLYDNLAFSVLDDGQGNLWMSGNRGVYRASFTELNDFADGRRSSINSYSYGTDDGMLTRECNGASPAGWKTFDGRLWFPTMKGLVNINPQLEVTNPPSVLIEKVELDQKELPESDSVEIAPGQKNLVIQYTAISWNRPKQIKFKYRLKNLDQNWTDAENRRTAYYPYLPPGEYFFEVIADNGDGVWTETGKSLHIKVLPPFYRTWWFFVLILLLMTGFLCSVFRFRIRQIEKSRRTQEEFSYKLMASQEKERQRIAAELHDSIGQTLAMIKNRAAFGVQTGDSEEAREQLKAITSQTSQAIGEVREISYNLRPYLLESLGLTRAVQSLVKKVEEVHLLEINAQIDDIDNLFSPEAEMSIYRIIQESLNNIAKHAEADEAELTIERADGFVTIKIDDDGCGFDLNAGPKSDVNQGGFGLLGINERVRMLGGTINIRTAAGQGMKMTVRVSPQARPN